MWTHPYIGRLIHKRMHLNPKDVLMAFHGLICWWSFAFPAPGTRSSSSRSHPYASGHMVKNMAGVDGSGINIYIYIYYIVLGFLGWTLCVCCSAFIYVASTPWCTVDFAGRWRKPCPTTSRCHLPPSLCSGVAAWRIWGFGPNVGWILGYISYG